MDDALLLGIETSCDETAAAVVQSGRRVLSSVVASQIEFHRTYGGVVPEIASRKHLETLPYVIEEALRQACATWEDLAALGVTLGPGLEGSLLVGLATAKAIAAARRKPLVGVNHIEGHLYANLLQSEVVEPPFLCLVASGGHSEVIFVRDHLTYETLGATRDDAAGEAFDKVGRLLGLPYPAGPEIDRLARQGDPSRAPFPIADLGSSFDFSFAGVKTAAYRYIQTLSASELEAQRADICAGFQEAIVQALVSTTLRAAEHLRAAHHWPQTDPAAQPPLVCISGGVAANRRLRELCERECLARGFRFAVPAPRYCTDNAAMIAAAAYFHWQRRPPDPLTLDVHPSLTLSSIVH